MGIELQTQKIKRQVGWFHWTVLFAGICLMVYGMNADQAVVEVPVVDAVTVRQLEAEKISLQRRVQELTAENKAKDIKIKSVKLVLAQYEQQLKDLRDSVPAQAVIYEALHKEAATEKGFRQAVARSFGNDIAAHIQIKGE